MSELDLKIERAQDVIAKVLPHYSHPIVMSSFGKDSVVMLDLLKHAGHKFPVLFHREPFFPKKYAFANRVIEEEEYTVYDYPPAGTSLIKNGDKIEIVNWYRVGKKFAYLPTGIRAPEEGKPFLCGYRDLYKKPLAAEVEFPWDLVFVGHKSSDKDPIYGEVPLNVDLKKNEGGPDYVFPLRYFTDEDIWEYSLAFGVRQNEQRYQIGSEFLGCGSEVSDITYNNDYHHACVRCMDRDEPETVLCPLIDQQITNISSEINYTDIVRPSYLGSGAAPQALGLKGSLREEQK
jgi:hypothetical protein